MVRQLKLAQRACKISLNELNTSPRIYYIIPLQKNIQVIDNKGLDRDGIESAERELLHCYQNFDFVKY